MADEIDAKKPTRVAKVEASLMSSGIPVKVRVWAFPVVCTVIFWWANVRAKTK